jgi:hypothetical protein
MHHKLFRMLPVSAPVCLLLHRLFRTLPVSPLICLLLRRLFRTLPVSPLVCLLLRRLFHTLYLSLRTLCCSIQKDLIMPFLFPPLILLFFGNFLVADLS